jgi:hypothetical protein
MRGSVTVVIAVWVVDMVTRGSVIVVRGAVMEVVRLIVAVDVVRSDIVLVIVRPVVNVLTLVTNRVWTEVEVSTGGVAVLVAMLVIVDTETDVMTPRKDH